MTNRLQRLAQQFHRPMSTLTAVSTENAPKALGPYVQAVKTPGLVFCSGCLGLEPNGTELLEGVEKQAEQALKNLRSVLEASGSSISKVAKTTVFLKSMDDFVAINKIYEKFFDGHKPARSCVELVGVVRI